MRFRASILLAALAVLLASTQSYAKPLNSEPARTCLQVEQRIIGPSPGVANSCLLFGGSIEVLAAEFRQARIEEHERLLHERAQERRERAARRRAERRAAEARLAKYVSASKAGMPEVAPRAVKAAVEAANAIATTPYLWGGGHGSFDSTGYDCSGAVSYVLHGGGLLDTTLDSTGLSGWGEPGPGKWITVYANADHAWMTIAGLPFDTVGGPGPRWHPSAVSGTGGFAVRHPNGY